MIFVFVDNAKGDITKSKLTCQHKTCWPCSGNKNLRSFFLLHHNPSPSVLSIDSRFIIDAEPPAVGLICIYGHGEPIVQPGMFATPFRAQSLDRPCALLRAS